MLSDLPMLLSKIYKAENQASPHYVAVVISWSYLLVNSLVSKDPSISRNWTGRLVKNSVFFCHSWILLCKPRCPLHAMNTPLQAKMVHYMRLWQCDNSASSGWGCVYELIGNLTSETFWCASLIIVLDMCRLRSWALRLLDSKIMRRAVISAGLTPPTLLAWPIVCGLTCRALELDYRS